MYYKVEAKCGHVGRNKYILKLFYVIAENGKEASKMVRNYPRVKHHHKDAIKSCKLITKDEYEEGKHNKCNDYYFLVTNKQDQLYLCNNIYNELQNEEQNEKYKKRKNKFKLKNKILCKYLTMNIKEALRYEQ